MERQTSLGLFLLGSATNTVENQEQTLCELAFPRCIYQTKDLCHGHETFSADSVAFPCFQPHRVLKCQAIMSPQLFYGACF